MFKFSKAVLLLLTILFLTACSSSVNGVSQNEFKEAEKFANIVNHYFVNMTEMNGEDKEYIQDFLDNVDDKNNKDEFTEESELFYVTLLKLYGSYEMSLGFKDMLDEIYKKTAEGYELMKQELINKYGVEFEDVD